MQSSVEIDLASYEIGFAKLEQLEALIVSTSGPGFEPFISLKKSFQENLFSLAADLAEDARQAFST